MERRAQPEEQKDYLHLSFVLLLAVTQTLQFHVGAARETKLRACESLNVLPAKLPAHSTLCFIPSMKHAQNMFGRSYDKRAVRCESSCDLNTNSPWRCANVAAGSTFVSIDRLLLQQQRRRYKQWCLPAGREVVQILGITCRLLLRYCCPGFACMAS